MPVLQFVRIACLRWHLPWQLIPTLTVEFSGYFTDFAKKKKAYTQPISGSSRICGWHSGSRGILLLWVAGGCASKHLRSALWLCCMHLPLCSIQKLLSYCCLLSSAPREMFRDGHCSLTDRLHAKNFWCCCLSGWHAESFRDELV